MTISNARGLRLLLLFIACAPLIMGAGGGLAMFASGVAFEDLNQNGVQDGEPGLVGWRIFLFDTATKEPVTLPQDTREGPPAGFYLVLLEPGDYTVCEELQPGWTQTAPFFAPPPAGVTLADCTNYTNGGSLTLGPRGYNFTLRSGSGGGVGLDFGNVQVSETLGSIRGSKFNDLNGNGVRDPGEPGIPDWDIHLIGDAIEQKPEPGPPVHARITVDRHTHRPPGGEQPDTCLDFPGCSTTTGGRVSIVLTQGALQAQATFNVTVPFQLGCVPNLPLQAEILGEILDNGFYIPLSDYWLPLPPPDLLVGLFAKIGVPIDPPAYLPVIKEVTARDCLRDPNPANSNANVTNPGILAVEADIGFASDATTKVVVASTSTNASGEYEFSLPPGTYTVCESLQPGWRQTLPGAGPGTASCAGTGAALGPRGHVVTLTDSDQAVDRDFGNQLFSGLTAFGNVQLWLGLKNSDDQGARFDLKVELLKNGIPAFTGLRRCIAGLTRNPALARGVVIPLDPVTTVPLLPTDVLALKISTRIGTNPDDTKCVGHSGALGLRLYYDSANRPSHFDATLTSDPSQARYLRSNGTTCPGGGSDSSQVTERTLPGTAPTARDAKCKDSSAIKFSGGNLFEEVGTWFLP